LNHYEELLVKDAEVNHKTYYTLHSRDTLRVLLANDPNIYKRCIITLKGWNLAICKTIEINDGESTTINIIGRKNCGICFNGDEVVVETNPKIMVIGVLKHHKVFKSYKFVCKVDTSGRQFVTPICGMTHQFTIINPKMLDRIKCPGAKDDLFMVEFLKWESNCRNPLGKILDTKSESFLDELDTLYQFSPDEEENEESKNVDDLEVHEHEARMKNNFNDAISIDKLNCRFPDDAFTVQLIQVPTRDTPEVPMYIIGVHIADVSYYVQKNDRNDKKATEREGTYYTESGNVRNHMLPEYIRKKCALNLNDHNLDEKKLTLSVKFEVLPDGTVTLLGIYESTIKIVKNYTFDEVQTILDNRVKTHDQWGSTKDLTFHEVHKIINLHQAAGILRNKRLGDAKFFSNEDSESMDAARLVEEISLEANRQIAIYLSKCETLLFCIPFRSQQAPSEDNLVNWCKHNKSILPISFYFLQYFEVQSEDIYFIKYNQRNVINVACKDIICELPLKQSTLHCLQSAVVESSNSVKQLLLLMGTEASHPKHQLAMRKWYKIQNRAMFGSSSVETGHYQLQFESYIQFTSPLRRYMDLVVHRLVKWRLHGEVTEPPYTADEIRELCDVINPRNINRQEYREDSQIEDFSISNKGIGWIECIG